MKKVIFFLGTVGLVLYCMFILTVSSLGANPISLNYKIPFQKEVSSLAPQGWAFFTKDVRKGFFKVYQQDSDETTYKELKIKSSSRDQLFGIKRENRVIMHKMSYLSKNIDSRLWYAHEGDVNLLPKDSLSMVSIDVDSPMLFGTFLIAKGSPLPYAWSIGKIKVDMEMEYLLVNFNYYKDVNINKSICKQ